MPLCCHTWRVLRAGYGDGHNIRSPATCVYGRSDEQFVLPSLGIKSSPSLPQQQPQRPSNTKVRYQPKSNRHTKYSNILTMPHRHPNRHAQCNNTKANHTTISTLPPTAPANTTTNTNKSSAAVQNTLYNVWCCRCGRLLNLQNVHYVQTCLCMHKRCDCCQTTPL